MKGSVDMEKETAKPLTKVKDLTAQTKSANVLARVLTVGEKREIQGRTGGPRELAEAVVGDETGTVILTLWGDQIGRVVQDDVIYLENGFVSLVRGHMRLNCGRYGTLEKSDAQLPEVMTSNDMSSVEHAQASRPSGERQGDRPSGGGPWSSEDRGRRGRHRDFSRDRGKDRRNRGRGRR